MQKTNNHVNLEKWHYVSTVTQSSKNIEIYERHLGVVKRIGDIVKRILGVVFSSLRPEGNLDKFYVIPKFWSGKRILTLEKIKEPTAASNSPYEVEGLIKDFTAYWDEDSKEFVGIPFDQKKFNETLEIHNASFTPIAPSKDSWGYIEKIDLTKSTQIAVRADLHGDLKSLIENIKTMQAHGLLDEHFKCKPDVHLVFLGDYGDRGKNAMEVFQLLIALRMQNPGQVTLIRGNHEDLSINSSYSRGDENFTGYLKDEGNRNQLNKFYESLSLTTYIGQEDESGLRQYVQFTHGMFELHVDPQEMLTQAAPIAHMAVKKERTLSERVIRIINSPVPSSVEGENSTALKTKKRILKQKIAALKIQRLIEEEKSNNPSREITVYNWGDVSKSNQTSYMGNPGRRDWNLAPQNVKDSLELSSSVHKIKLVFRGHQHELQHHCALNDKLVVTTMPVGMDSPYSRNFLRQYDTVYVLTTAPKVKDWTKQSFLREPGQSTKEITPSVPIRDTEIKLKNPVGVRHMFS